MFALQMRYDTWKEMVPRKRLMPTPSAKLIADDQVPERCDLLC